jgi:hypothetical protein
VEHFASPVTDANEPITEMVVNSIITNLTPGQKVQSGRAFVAGRAWDGGRGIAGVDVSADGGQRGAAPRWAPITADFPSAASVSRLRRPSAAG